MKQASARKRIETTCSLIRRSKPLRIPRKSRFKRFRRESSRQPNGRKWEVIVIKDDQTQYAFAYREGKSPRTGRLRRFKEERSKDNNRPAAQVRLESA
jgi:hypothetical protein